MAYPRYWINDGELPLADWTLGFRNISHSTNDRSFIAHIIPRAAVAHSISCLLSNLKSEQLWLLSNLCAFTFDFVVRQKMGGLNMSYFIVKQLPVLPPNQYSTRLANAQLGPFVATRALELTYTAWDLKAFALDCSYDGPPFRWDEERRFQIRCELDAAYFHLYLGGNNEWGMANGKDESEGVNETLLEMFPTPRDAVSHIMDTFPIVRRKDEAKYGEYRTKRVILEIYDAMAEVIKANSEWRIANSGKSEEEIRKHLRSYQSPLDPSPGPPTDADGNFIPYAEWTEEIHRQCAGVIHPPKRTVVDWPRVELVRDILLVLEAWQSPASISAIEPALLLMRDDRSRAIFSNRNADPKQLPSEREPTKLEGISAIYQILVANGTLEQVGESGYRLAKSELTSDFPDSIKAKARDSVAIVRSFNQPEEAHRAVFAQRSYDFQISAT